MRTRTSRTLASAKHHQDSFSFSAVPLLNQWLPNLELWSPSSSFYSLLVHMTNCGSFCFVCLKKQMIVISKLSCALNELMYMIFHSSIKQHIKA